MSELNIRKAEALAGFYCHPDIIKFIYNVLLNFETPIVLDKLKEVKNEKNSNNTAISIPIMSINNLLNDTGTSPIINNTNITNNSTIPVFTFNSGIPPITNNNSTFTTFNNGFNSNSTNNSTIPAFKFNTGISPITTNNLNISNNSAFSPFKTGFNTNNINNMNNSNNTINSNITNNINNINNTNNTNKIDLYYTKNLNNATFEKDALFIFDNKKINSDTELHFKCNVFKDEKNIIHEDVFLFASKYLKNTEHIKTYETQIPNNYIMCDENDVVNNYLFNLLNLCSIIIQCNENGEYIFNQIHLFLKGFEKLLTQVFIPCLNNYELKKYIHKDIIDSITLPVLFAFGNEFKYHNLSLKTRLINKKVSIQEFEWLKKLVLDKNLLLNFIREEPEKIDCWLHNTSYLICSYLNFNN